MYPYWWLPFWLNVAAFVLNSALLIFGIATMPVITIVCVVLTGILSVMCAGKIIEYGQSFFPWK